MCKELKRLILLADCPHLNKTDRDSIQWAIQNLSPEQAETETSFGGWDFSLWPSVPDKKAFDELIKSRKAKKKVIMTQAYIDGAAQHLHELVTNHNITVNQALSVATTNGWQGFKASWIVNEIGKQEEVQPMEIKTPNDAIKMVNSGQITCIKAIPRPVRLLIETQYRIGNLKPTTMTNLERIGLVL
jgi:hypothetical protein